MATYKQIQAYVLNRHGFKPKTCWIAHVKEMSGLAVLRAWNRRSDQREEPCPPERVRPIREGLRHYGMISSVVGAMAVSRTLHNEEAEE